MLRRYSPSATDPEPSVPRSIASTSARSRPGFTRALTRYRIFPLDVLRRRKNLEVPGHSRRPLGDHAFRQGVATEVLNPKTALFFLSFLPQFVNPALGRVTMQFLLLGVISVSLNTTADLIVVSFAAPIGNRLRSSSRFRRNQRVGSGVAMIGLGA